MPNALDKETHHAETGAERTTYGVHGDYAIVYHVCHIDFVLLRVGVRFLLEEFLAGQAGW